MQNLGNAQICSRSKTERLPYYGHQLMAEHSTCEFFLHFREPGPPRVNVLCTFIYITLNTLYINLWYLKYKVHLIMVPQMLCTSIYGT